MQSKTFALFALTASAVLASPFHRRQEAGHRHRHHGTGGLSTGVRPSGSGSPFAVGNDTDGFFTATAITNTDLATLIVTKTVSPIPASSGGVPANFGNAVVDASSSCTTTSLVTEVSTNFVTVTASPVANSKVIETNGNSVSAGAFYGGQGSRSWGGYGQSQAAPSAASSAAAAPFQPSAANPSTTFATATKSSAPSGSASVPSSGSSSGSSSGGKRGISFNDASLVSAFSGAVSWAYNWGATASGSLGVEFVPMCWGQADASTFASKVGSATHVLSFNEPDLGAQSNMSPSTAANLHKQVFSSLKGKVQIGSPAVTNGVKAADGSPMGVNWLDEFFTACGGSACPVDFVAYHWYATASSFDYFKQQTEAVIAVAQRYGVSKVWLTEFEPSGSDAEQAAFMTQAVAYLDSNPSVERYAAFMASDGTLLSGKSLNTVGAAYAGA